MNQYTEKKISDMQNNLQPQNESQDDEVGKLQAKCALRMRPKNTDLIEEIGILGHISVTN